MKRKEKSQRQRRQSWEGSDAEVGTESTETNGEQGPAVPGPHSSVLVSLVPEDVSWLVERERQRGAWRERHAQLFLGYCILCAPSWSLTIKQASPILAGREWSPPPHLLPPLQAQVVRACNSEASRQRALLDSAQGRATARQSLGQDSHLEDLGPVVGRKGGGWRLECGRLRKLLCPARTLV
jgi:hypothetical protein